MKITDLGFTTTDLGSNTESMTEVLYNEVILNRRLWWVTKSVDLLNGFNGLMGFLSLTAAMTSLSLERVRDWIDDWGFVQRSHTELATMVSYQIGGPSQWVQWVDRFSFFDGSGDLTESWTSSTAVTTSLRLERVWVRSEFGQRWDFERVWV